MQPGAQWTDSLQLPLQHVSREGRSVKEAPDSQELTELFWACSAPSVGGAEFLQGAVSAFSSPHMVHEAMSRTAAVEAWMALLGLGA